MDFISYWRHFLRCEWVFRGGRGNCKLIVSLHVILPCICNVHCLRERRDLQVVLGHLALDVFVEGAIAFDKISDVLVFNQAKFIDGHKLTAYYYGIDNETVAALSSQTLGLRYQNQWAVGDNQLLLDLGWVWT